LASVRIRFCNGQSSWREGAAVIVASSRKERVDGAAARLPERAERHMLDLTSEEQVRTFFDRVGELDNLVFTAGETLQLGEL
jgi:NAD(P)-dependent dehydrogenase (short-subunit alcohol dehydrogenase family)